MARRPRSAPRDYSHLRDRPLPFVIDQAVAYPPPDINARQDNLDLLTMFGPREVLRYSELMDTFLAAGLWRSSPGNGRRWSTNYAGERAGRLVGIGLREGVLADERTDEGERAFRLLCREPLYETVGDHIIRVRLLSPEQAEALDAVRTAAAKRARATEKLRATLARKHAEALRPALLAKFVEMGRLGVVIPPSWDAFVPADIRERWPQVAHSMNLLIDQHMGWDKPRQIAWFKLVDRTLGPAVTAELRQKRAARLAAEAAALETPAEDLEALARF